MISISSEDNATIIRFPEDTILIEDVSISDTHLTAYLNDGRIISTPLEWYPRLLKAPKAFRDNWYIAPSKIGITWEDVNEDIHVNGMLAGLGGTRAQTFNWERRDENGRYLLKDEYITE